MSRKRDAGRTLDVVVVTGLSGSGKSTAIDALEDAGYYCIDNLPTALVAQFVELCAASRELPELRRLGLGLDLRDSSYVEHWPQVRAKLEAAGHNVFVVFLDASDEVLLRRFSETRRAHPLGHSRDLPEAILAERRMLEPAMDRASLVIDTTELSVHELKQRIREAIVGEHGSRTPIITIKSFGYKYGIATDADMIFDARFLPNPFFVERLRPLSGLNEDVARYVLDRDETKELLGLIDRLLDFVLPRFRAEGRSYVTVGIGCTGGRHRSVVLAERLGEILHERGYAVNVRHRDIERGS